MVRAKTGPNEKKPDQRVEGTLEKATVETLHPRPGQTVPKIVLAFKGKQRRLILNVGNANKPCDIAGDDTEDWVGVVVRLRPVQFTADKRTILVEPGEQAEDDNSN